MLTISLMLSENSFCQSAQRLRYSEAVQLVEQRNLEIKAARARLGAADAGIRIARQYPNPTLTFGVARDTPHENVLIDQPLELGPKRSYRIKVAQEERTLAQIEFSTTERSVFRRTRESFYTAVRAQQNAQVAADAVTLNKQLMNIAKERFDAGDVPELEVLQTQLEEARSEAEYKVALQEQRSALVELNAILNEPAVSSWLLEPADDSGMPSLEVEMLLQKAYQSNPEIQHLVQEKNVEAMRRKQLTWERLPNVDIQAGTDLNSPPDFNVGPRGQISMALPLFSRNQGQIAQSTANVSFLDLSLTWRKRLVEAQVESVLGDFQAKKDQAAIYRRELIPQTEKLESMAEESYKEGKSGILTVVDAQRRLIEIRRTYIDNLLNLQKAFGKIEEVVGTSLQP